MFVYVYTHICLYMCTHTWIYDKYMSLYICVYVYNFVYIGLFLHIYTSQHAYMYTCTHVHTCTRICIHMHLYRREHTSTCIYMKISYTHTHTDQSPLQTPRLESTMQHFGAKLKSVRFAPSQHSWPFRSPTSTFATNRVAPFWRHDAFMWHTTHSLAKRMVRCRLDSLQQVN